MDIYRYEKIKENNITKSGEKLIDSDVKCHYSAGSLADTGSEVPTLVSSHKLFCSVGKIQEGDKVIVTQGNGNKVTLIIGEGFPYSSGMQHSVKRDGKA
jgi:hypothetical protein